MALLPGAKGVGRDVGQRDGLSELVRAGAQPATGIDLQEQRMGHQLLRTFMALRALETRRTMRPSLASGAVAQ